MAQPGFDKMEPLAPGDSNARLSSENARQGQNVKGMIWVLIIGTLLVAGAYGVMLSLQTRPNAVVNESRGEAASAPTTQQFPSSPSTNAPQPQQETAGSPN